MTPHCSQVDALAEFAQQIREARPEENDEQLAADVDESARFLRQQGLPEWTVFAALAGLLRHGAPPA